MMKSTGTINNLVNVLSVLDICIEIEKDSASIYQNMANDAQQKGPKSVLNWLGKVESSRLRRLAERRCLVLKQHPELAETGAYESRKETGLTKMGSGSAWLAKSGCLEILRYAIENEARAKQFFRRKALLSTNESLRFMYDNAVNEQEDQIEYLAALREVLLHQQVDRGVMQVAEAIA
jgi:rubrerythrin